MWVAIGIIGGIFIICGLNYLIYKRSMSASIAEFVLRLSPYKRRTLEKTVKKQKKPYKVPKVKCKIEKFDYEDMPVYLLSNAKREANKLVFYVHGGAYVVRPTKFHWKFCDKLVRKTGVSVVFPLYPLAPQNTWEQAHTKLENLYTKILEKHNGEIITMGDSAGGGIITSLSMTLVKKGIKMPDKTILLSPCVNIAIKKREIAKIEKVDPMLSVKNLTDFVKAWVGKTRPNDYRISPIYGDVKGLENIYIFVGTREILYPDIIKFYEKCKEQNVNAQLIVGKNLNHVYPLYPIVEGVSAFKQICGIIEK